VRKSGNRVRITTQLIRSSDSSHLWSQTYDRDLNDIFAVQDEISNEVVDALKLKLLKPSASASSESGGTQEPAAYEAFLRGRHLRHEGEGEATLRGAIAAFDEAISLDPKYARAYAGKADALNALASNGYVPFDSGFAEARRTAERALEIDPRLAEALLALVFVQVNVDMNAAVAADSADRALRLSPGSYDVLVAYSGIQVSMGRREASVDAARKAVALDPIAPGAYTNLGGNLIFARRYDEAERAARRALELAPDRPSGHYSLGWALLMQGRNDEALAEFDRESIEWQRRAGVIWALARKGDLARARKELKAYHDAIGDAASYQYAQISTLLGDHDEAFRWLANARRIHDPGLMGQVYDDPLLEPLRSDPRYVALVRELGFPARR
jgi:tetratricopeptide (TPR) repeat protein